MLSLILSPWMSTTNSYWLQVGQHPSYYFLYISGSVFSSLKTQTCPLPPSTISWARAWSCSLVSPSSAQHEQQLQGSALLWITGTILLLALCATVLHPLCKHPTPVWVRFSVEGVAQQEPGSCQVPVAPPVPVVAGGSELPSSPGSHSGPPAIGLFSEELLLKLWVIIKSSGELFVTESCSQSQTHMNCLACCAI